MRTGGGSRRSRTTLPPVETPRLYGIQTKVIGGLGFVLDNGGERRQTAAHRRCCDWKSGDAGGPDNEAAAIAPYGAYGGKGQG